MYRAVLDTCVLVPDLQRDFLLQLAAEEAYTPLWGTGILHELDYVLAALAQRRRLAADSERRRHLFDRMREAFPGALIDAPKSDDANPYGLNDPGDSHVAHAAIIGKADAIVTDDRRAGFRAAPALIAAHIDVLHPHEFAAHTVAAYPIAGLRAVRALSVRRNVVVADILDVLRVRYGMVEAAALISAARAVVGCAG
ncbi:MAG: PIN domain-containing protein [Microbacterium sp.]